jgi:hypothetical protein
VASPHATLADVLRGDVTNLRNAYFDHTSRHRCRTDSGCELRRILKEARDYAREIPDVPIRVEGRLGARVPKPGLDRLDVGAISDEQAGEVVP